AESRILMRIPSVWLLQSNCWLQSIHHPDMTDGVIFVSKSAAPLTNRERRRIRKRRLDGYSPTAGFLALHQDDGNPAPQPKAFSNAR
ncbi:hypothetical protein, partial [Flavobacterium psychrophilum]|uniref:hypothetical protein n=1 Tax=Flavobacterium psychrophilum TaxID=96345 RepID=UPI001A9567FE